MRGRHVPTPALIFLLACSHPPPTVSSSQKKKHKLPPIDDDGKLKPSSLSRYCRPRSLACSVADWINASGGPY
ncbi:hypothetical protein NL676_002119 [Syzygium grande]|nr:hypothetical protein NL676_002119 [Syzygium grande]